MPNLNAFMINFLFLFLAVKSFFTRLTFLKICTNDPRPHLVASTIVHTK